MPFQIVRNDITAMKADAIVNTANPEAAYAGGTDGAVYRAAGAEKLLAARRKLGPIATGEAAVTPAFALGAKYIIHTVGPVWQGGTHDEADMMRRCYENSLRLALEHGCESIAFPLISTGTYGFPKGEALPIALSAIREFLSKEDMTVYLVIFDRESFELSGKLFTDIDSYINENYAEDRLAEEYDMPPVSAMPLPSPGRNVPANALPPVSAPRTANPAQSAMPQTDHLSAAYTAMPQAAQLSDTIQASMPLAPAQPCPARSAVPKTPKTTNLAQTAMPQAAKPSDDRHGLAKFLRPKAKPIISERSIDDVIAEIGENFQQRLLRLIDESGLTDVEVYKRANLDRKLFSKIRCNANYRPKKATAIALALALELNLDETKDLLSRAELALSPSSKFDLIIQYFIDREVYDIYAINLALFRHGQPLLGE